MAGGGGGGGIFICSRSADEFLLKSVVFKFVSKEISRAEHEYMHIHPPPPPPLVSALFPMSKHDSYGQNSSAVCTSITLTFPTANAPFELANRRDGALHLSEQVFRNFPFNMAAGAYRKAWELVKARENCKWNLFSVQKDSSEKRGQPWYCKNK